MSRISDLAFRFLHRLLGASEATPAVLTASGGTASTAICAALTQADDFWNGAICRWDSGDNAGRVATVADFDAASDTLTFDDDLPFAVVNGDTFTLFAGGKYVSDQPMPLLSATSPVLCTGFEIVSASPCNDAGTGTLTFRLNGGDGAQTLSWTPPGGSEGGDVIVGDLSVGSIVELLGSGTNADAESQLIVVERTAAAMPTADCSDDVLLSPPVGIFPPIQDDVYSNGTTLYRAIGLKNAAASKLYNVTAFCRPPTGAVASTLATALGLGAGVLRGDDLTSWPVQGWVYNATKDDVRFYADRSGSEAGVLAPGAGMRGKVAVAWEIGDDIEAFPWIDIGLEPPGVGNAFADPVDQHTAPAGVVFSCPTAAAALGLEIGSMAAGALHCVWVRLVIPAGVRPLNAGDVRVSISADPTE